MIITRTQHLESTVNSVSIVQDFIILFPDYPLGRPRNRKLRFTIDLATRVILVFKAPYSMATDELRELKS